MGIIKAAADLVKGNLGDQWLEVYEAENMGDQTVFTRGVQIRRGQNTKGTDNTVSNGSVVHVYDNQEKVLWRISRSRRIWLRWMAARSFIIRRSLDIIRSTIRRFLLC